MTFASPPEICIRSALTADDRKACFAIRQAVFVREQNVPADLEYDELDSQARHYLAAQGELPIGCARAVDLGDTVKIGRVAVLPEYRGRSVGAKLMTAVLADAVAAGHKWAVLHAQTSALPFYEKLGFLSEGGEFSEADIPHFAMRKELL